MKSTSQIHTSWCLLFLLNLEHLNYYYYFFFLILTLVIGTERVTGKLTLPVSKVLNIITMKYMLSEGLLG